MRVPWNREALHESRRAAPGWQGTKSALVPVITGMGVVSPLGIGLDSTSRAYADGISCVGINTVFDSRGFGQPLAGQAPPFDPRPYFRTPKAMKLCDRRTRLAVVASALALTDAGLDEATDAERERIGVLLGTSGSDLAVPDLARALDGLAADEAAEGKPAFAQRVLNGLNPLWLLINLPNMSSAHVAMQAGLRGPNATVMTDWMAGVQALGEACDLIRTGEADCVLAGGADTGVMPLAYAAFAQEERFGHGFIPAEAAAIFVIESSANAEARGARVRANIGPYVCGRLVAQALEETGWRTSVDVLCVARAGLSPLALETPHAPVVPSTSRIVDASGLAGHALAAAVPLSMACALAAGRRGRLLAWQAAGDCQAALGLECHSMDTRSGA